ncbi:pyrimidine reductase family protein [Marihabitans asiaticum]|uniref:Riboflavin biosynthesis pyrimidine reductase n=1 Tax=Marihabitans asiaticum TaxID=415218 RepID=A0A560WA45_9MICO|nr:pyrimidine reductase family protein [Marihabitans asiaticum]TWD14497.1 riboflavin biosynthesis pyrimidine reductase [Marihabitans asiaticum]
MPTLRRLLPTPADSVDAGTEYTFASRPGPVVRSNMVSSVDGSGVLDGRSGPLSGAVDLDLLLLQRSLSDVVLVGAGTVRAEGYGAVRTRPQDMDHRGDRPLRHPQLAVVSASLDLDLSSPAFVDAPERPIMITCATAPPGRIERAGEVAEVIVAGERRVDAARAVDELAARGLTRILSEGGPSLLGDLVADDLVDELSITISPTLVGGGDASRITGDVPAPAPRGLALAAAYEADDFLFLRYGRA